MSSKKKVKAIVPLDTVEKEPEVVVKKAEEPPKQLTVAVPEKRKKKTVKEETPVIQPQVLPPEPDSPVQEKTILRKKKTPEQKQKEAEVKQQKLVAKQEKKKQLLDELEAIPVHEIEEKIKVKKEKIKKIAEEIETIEPTITKTYNKDDVDKLFRNYFATQFDSLVKNAFEDSTKKKVDELRAKKVLQSGIKFI